MRSSVPVECVLLPAELNSRHVEARDVVVFDVLRATTSMTAALDAGVSEIRIFPDVVSAADAAKTHTGPRLLCGETRCIAPAGFDLGNSPGAFRNELHAGQTAYLATTNGTRALIAARGAAGLFAGAILNASAVARVIARTGRDKTLLCAGTDGQVALEDLLGAGAVLAALVELQAGHPAGDVALIALNLFKASRDHLPEILATSEGGKNVIAAGLPQDVAVCARLDASDIVGQVLDHPLRVVRSES